jgi:hypothetical protein
MPLPGPNDDGQNSCHLWGVRIYFGEDRCEPARMTCGSPPTWLQKASNASSWELPWVFRTPATNHFEHVCIDFGSGSYCSRAYGMFVEGTIGPVGGLEHPKLTAK